MDEQESSWASALTWSHQNTERTEGVTLRCSCSRLRNQAAWQVWNLSEASRVERKGPSTCNDSESAGSPDETLALQRPLNLRQKGTLAATRALSRKISRTLMSYKVSVLFNSQNGGDPWFPKCNFQSLKCERRTAAGINLKRKANKQVGVCHLLQWGNWRSLFISGIKGKISLRRD